MGLFIRSLAAAILTAGCFIPPVNVVAQSPLLGPSTTPAPNLSDQKLSAVAAALERIASLQKDYRQRIAEAEPADKDRIVAQAHGEFTKAVTDQGLSLEEYGAILDMARDNPEIRGNLLERIRPAEE
jgi:Domain of unknown function (DUF4168)